MRFLWILAGWASVLAGLIGAVLPLLPTTPFLLLAAFCFARSSPALYDWLTTHRHFGPIIHNWQTYRAIDLRSKKLATIFAVLALLGSVWLGVRPAFIGLQAVPLLAAMLFIWTRPTADGTHSKVAKGSDD